MPTLVQPANIDTTLPGGTRRRLWSAPAVKSHSVVLLTLTKIYLSPAGQTLRPEAVAALETSFDLESSFGPLATVIDLASLTRVRLDLLANTLAIEYTRPGDSNGRSDGSKAQVTITLADAEVADQIYSKVWRRVGDRLTLKPYSPPWAEMIRLPLAVMAGILFAVVAVSLLVSAAPDLGGPLRALGSADWRIVCGVGGAVLAGVQVWLYRRVTRPPVRLELVRVYDGTTTLTTRGRD